MSHISIQMVRVGFRKITHTSINICKQCVQITGLKINCEIIHKNDWQGDIDQDQWVDWEGKLTVGL